MTSELGTVISSPEGPSTRNFAFVLTDTRVRRGQFVQVEGDDGAVVAIVNELFRGNRYFERAESISEYEKNSGAKGAGGFFTSFPAAEWEYAVANCKVLGAWKEGKLGGSASPPSPGARVKEIDLEFLKQFLGFDEKNGLEMGKVLQHDIPARINLSRMLHKHLALLGISGSGKSNAASVIVEELVSRERERGRVAVVIFDVHGEYASFADRRRNPDYGDKTLVANDKNLKIAFHKIKPRQLAEFLPDMSATQLRELTAILSSMRKQMSEGQKAYDLKETMEAIGRAAMKDNIKAPLLAWISELRSMRLFGRSDFPSIKEALKPGSLTVIDMSGINSQKRKQIIVSYFANKIFRLRQDGKIPPTLILVEEAHNFAREKAPKGSSIAKGAIETIAREGRKFGVSLCLVSQRPVQLSTTALSQCNSFLIFKISNPYDLDHIQQSCEAIDADVAGQITSLKVGEGILLGEAVNYPLFLRVRARKSLKSNKAETLEELAKEFEEGAPPALSEQDVESFI
ncbi:DUF87 domain-containing protein [Candidatus Micrarchaeota archaeon]|nr:DUF87 domain-containing protein [Candidatus Micrarchaeota archaeon]